ncbi:MAG: hypothetical protein M3O32_00185 [Actinomycetota bacterium]|nr:hypothetical protein [Actinomycetota bacterium]
MGSAVLAGESPGETDSGVRVLSLFRTHAGAQKASNLLAALSVVFLLIFAALLRQRLLDRGAEWLSSVAFGGAVILAVGGAARAGIGWALATGHDHIEPAAAQALNVVFESHYPAITGIAVLMFAAWLSIVRSRALPLWLGWAALPIGLLAVAPPSLVPLIGAGVWIAVAGILMARREDPASVPV